MPVSTLYVTGFVKGTKAKELGDLFEKFGQIKRVDIPPPRSDDGQQYAFIEYLDVKDAENALEKTKDGLTGELALDDDKGMVVQWARSDPYPTRSYPPRGRGGYGRGSYGRGGYGGRYGGRYDDYPPRRDYGGYPPRGRDYPPRDRDRDRDYPPRDRDYPPRERDYPPRDRYGSRERDYPRDRDYPPRDRDYPPRDRDYPPRERDYPPRGRYSSRDESSYDRSEGYDAERRDSFRSDDREKSVSRDRSRSPVRD